MCLLGCSEARPVPGAPVVKLFLVALEHVPESVKLVMDGVSVIRVDRAVVFQAVAQVMHGSELQKASVVVEHLVD
jgi:hypothetical protein